MISLKWWETTGKEGLWGDKNNMFNSAVWIFNMRNKFGWRDDPKKHEVTESEDGKEVTIKLSYDPSK